MVQLALTVAAARNGVIGANGEMPWRLSSDLRRFRRLTIGKPVIMGRKTFESIGRPLPGRANIVVTRSRDFQPEGVSVAHDPAAALALARQIAQHDGVEEIHCIGGGQIYEAFLPHADRIYLTHVIGEIEGDTHFPPLDPSRWREKHGESVPAGEKDSHATRFSVYERLVP